ncbi:class I SAM-dependent methyltransferase [Flavobacteriaceae bacterium XHP0103]|uniref:class I SAM-dependent methyltransferase n=1 Tax=Marixanthotalea marina TaxID=2844359 RepID=UPI002989E764|nr:class I SAM-dependent methyltransferase [Marixanthotalea marina]MBU3820629.1 class I SAM-dependent methyltransferase [Marixanthotalea marina]
MTQKNQENIYLKVKDYSVSGETFDLIYDSEFDLLETQPKPALEKLSHYYKSEDYISHTDAKRNLFERIYHLVREFALKRKLNLVNSLANEKENLLDVGCGTGDFLNVCKINGWNVLGVEPDEDARSIANQKVGDKVFGSEQLHQLEPNTFDVITLWHVLEHLPEPGKDLAIFKKLLKPEGVLIIAVPNYKSFDAMHYKEFWAAYDVPRHLWHFSKTAISKLVTKQNMHIEKIKPMWFDAFYVSLLSDKYKTGKMNVFKGFWVGLQSNIKFLSSKEASSMIYVVKNTKN